MNHSFDTLSAHELEQVSGGLSFSLDLSKGLQIDSKLVSASISLPKPSNIIKGLTSSITDALGNIGKLTDLGQLFNFI